MHENSRLMFERYGRPFIRAGDRVLEIGPDAIPSTYQRATLGQVACWHTLDFRGDPLLTYTLDEPYRFPIADCTYDVVISGQVAEHVPMLWQWMEEVARVCRTSGTVITIAPVTWPYHEAPQDCWRIYPEGLRALYEHAGLTTVFARWDSVELEHVKKRLPRRLRGRRAWSQLAPAMLLLHDRARFPVAGAFDTIAVAPVEPEDLEGLLSLSLSLSLSDADPGGALTVA